MITETEKTITSRLKEVFNEFEVDSFPVDFQKYDFLSPKGCILVRFENSTIKEQQTTTAVNSEETYNFTIFAAFRYRQKHSDTYQFLTQFKTVLNGIEILNKRLVLKKTNFENEINGDLWYSFDVEITLPINDNYEDTSEANQVIGILDKKIKIA